MMNTNTSFKNHYAKFWGSSFQEATFERGPVSDLPNEFEVLLFPPQNRRNFWVYATAGMSSRSDRQSIELHLFSPNADKCLVELLYVVCHFHITGHGLGLHHSVNIGRPWLNDSNATSGYVSLPYLYGPSLEDLTLSNGQVVKCYWFIPITPEEVAFKKERGWEALEERFESNQFNYLNPNRESCV